MSTGVLCQIYRATVSAPVDQVIPAIVADLQAALGVRGEHDLDQAGLHILASDEIRVRCYADADAGVLLAEVAGRDPSSGFEVFVVPHEDGDLRAGWRRPWAPDDAAPSAWDRIQAHIEVQGRVQPQVDPDFAVLLAALVAGDRPQIVYEDASARASLAADVSHLRETVAQQAAQLRKLQIALSARGNDSDAQDIPPPAAQREWRLVDLAEWAELHADVITVLPRAISEAKKSDLENNQLVFDALDMLATTYRSVKLSEVPREELKARADQLGLFLGGSTSFAGEYGDAYFVQYGGRRRFLDQHVGRGTSRDPRFSVRIYFFWDDEARRVVVGWLPSHLPNSLT